MTDRITTLDFSSFRAADPAVRRAIAERLGACFERYGFVSLVGHGIPRETIQAGFGAAEAFFAQAEPAKLALQDRRNNRGYIPLFDSQRPGEKPSGLEAFSIGHTGAPTDAGLLSLPFYAPTPWPDLPGFRDRVEALYRALFGVGEDLLRACALHLGAPEDFFAAMARDTYSNMRLVHYPPQEAVAGTSDFGVHVDRGLITLLIQDMNGGLAVRDADDAWLPVVPDPEAIVINVGTLLRRWTNGRYRAALHRVINASGRERYSVPLFFHPSFHALIDPRSLVRQAPAGPEFEPAVAGEMTYAGFMRDRPSWQAEKAGA